MYTIKSANIEILVFFPYPSIACKCGAAFSTKMGSENGKWSIFKSKIQNEYGENIIDFHTLVS